MGCVGVLLAAALRRRVTRRALGRALQETALVSSMIFTIVVVGYLVARFLALTGITQKQSWLAWSWGAFPRAVGAALPGAGAMVDVFGMLVLTIPFVMPVVGELGIDPVWFGVFAVMMAELALVTPFSIMIWRS